MSIGSLTFENGYPEWRPNRDRPNGKGHDTQSPLALDYFHTIKANLEASDFVEGLLIEGAMSVVYGEPASGKTFWTTDLALHVAWGRLWNGREVEVGGVIYCALEGSFGIDNRIAA